jgi:protein TonB
MIYGFTNALHLISKHTAMTNKEILQASLLDIIFENRNKAYGAYALRNEYDKRLIKALTTGLGLVLLFVLLNYIKFSNPASTGRANEKDGNKLISVIMEPEKQPGPEKPKEPEKLKPATVDHQNIQVVPDKDVSKPIVENNAIGDNDISDKDSDGPVNDNPRVADPAGDLSSGEAGKKPDVNERPVIKIPYRAPEYPGGVEALQKFMIRNLVTPDELELGDKKIVKVRFLVDEEGNIKDITVLESPGRDYEKEVIRVVKKMPQWLPGIQNDKPVSVSYVLPITFMAVEE